MRSSLLVFVFFIVAGFHDRYNSRPAMTLARSIDSLSNRVLIINSFDASTLHVRHSKRELFADLADSLKSYVAEYIMQDSTIEVVVIPDVMRGDTDNLVFSLLEEKNASKALLIRSLDVYFDEGGEKREEGFGDEKDKIVTSYNLCTNVGYSMYGRTVKLKQSDIVNCEFFTARSVNDSHFTIKFGPDIVGKKKHTYASVKKNALKYLSGIENELKTGN
ncbi:MAG TPA: hypothetical protein VFD24_01060 [Chitinophagaceae bacterium]|jgi:hypothetical protein|nr:hypothetical protein [Chitinophagaceae bacterium]